MLFSLLPKQLLLLLAKKFPHSFQVPVVAQQISTDLPCWKGGKPAACDVTVISPLQQLTINKASVTQGAALSTAEERKYSTHADSCRIAGISFIPLAVETLGGWSREGVDFIRSVGRLQGQHLGLDPLETTHHLFQRLSVILWRGNACMWLSRAISFPPSTDGHY
jgi:hypothetical protein